MFEIDLLKGKGRPHKTDLKRMIAGLIMLLIPVMATMMYAAGAQHDRIRLASLHNAAAANEARLGQYAEDMRFLADLRGQINNLSLSIGDIGQALNYRMVISPVLVELAEHLPPEIFMREMNLRRTPQRQRKVDATTGAVSFDTIIQRSIKLSLCGHDSADGDAAVQTYIARLEAAPALKPLLREIRPASRQQTELRGENVTIYEIELFLKDQR